MLAVGQYNPGKTPGEQIFPCFKIGQRVLYLDERDCSQEAREQQLLGQWAHELAGSLTAQSEPSLPLVGLLSGQLLFCIRWSRFGK